ncbi:ABC transporter permease [bacterium]|nr:ABC transporter permease [bacterium]
MNMGPHHRPPRLAEWLLRRLGHIKGWDTLADDIGEAYNSMVEKSKKSSAILWYWGHVLKTVPGALRNTYYWRSNMIRNHLKIAFRHMNKHRGITAINLVGMGVGLAAVLFILFFLRLELSFDHHHVNADRIVRAMKSYVGDDDNRTALVPPALSPALVADFPEIEAGVRLIKQNDVHIMANSKNFFERGIVFCDSSLFKVFSFDFIHGHAESVFSDPNGIVLSESMAYKYFGKENPLGETVTYKGQTALIVTGVVKDQPGTSSLIPHFMISLDMFMEMKDWANPDSWGASFLNNYFLLRPGVSLESVEAKSESFLQRHYESNKDHPFNLKFIPLKQIHFQTRRSTITLFGGIASLVLIVAIMNYINLATARASTRSKEIGLRKVIGAQRKALLGQFITESVLFSLIAFMAGLALVASLMPGFNSLLGTHLSLSLIFDPVLLSWLGGLIIVVGLCAGLYPALIITSTKPADIFRKQVMGHSKSILRSTLVVFQVIITVVLIALTLVIAKQMRFINQRDMGFEQKNILAIDVRDDRLQKNKMIIRQLLKAHPAIQHASFASSLANSSDYMTNIDWPGKEEGREQDVWLNFVDEEFADVFNLELTAGRDFKSVTSNEKDAAFLVNETLVRALGWDDPVGKSLEHFIGGRKGTVVGVVKDFHMLSLQESIAPMIMDLWPDWDKSSLAVALNQNPTPELIGEIESIIKRFAPDYPFVMDYFEDRIKSSYTSEIRMQKLFGLFSILAVCIAGMGLFGLTAFTVQRQTREIGIRKTLGASIMVIVYQLSRQLGRNVLIGNLIAWPLIWWLAGKWLMRFAYRVDVDWYIFAGSTVIVLLVSVLTISAQAFKAARANPADSLRYE